MPIALAAQPPTDTREVIAEGRAALTGVDLESARQAALQSALRSAVEKVLGVSVSGQTLTKNYELVRDQVLTHAEGHVILKEVLRVVVGQGQVTVRVRAQVSARPLLEQARALGLARHWRVRVETTLALASLASLEQALAEAGFRVVGAGEAVDLTVTLAPKFSTVASVPLETSVGKVTLSTVRGEVVVRAVRGESGAVVASRMQVGTARHVRVETAQAQVLAEVGPTLARQIAEDLLVVPTLLFQPVSLTVRGGVSVEQAARLAESVAALPLVSRATVRSVAGGVAHFDLDVLTDSPLAAALPALGLQVQEQSRGRITAQLRATPKPAPRQPGPRRSGRR